MKSKEMGSVLTVPELARCALLLGGLSTLFSKTSHGHVLCIPEKHPRLCPFCAHGEKIEADY